MQSCLILSLFLDLLRGFWLWIRQESGVYGNGAYLYIQQDPVINTATEVVLSQLPVGRYIEILLPGKGRQLSLCEVEVYGGKWCICFLGLRPVWTHHAC